MLRALTAAAVVLLVGCGGDDSGGEERAVPDRVAVPERDATPPRAAIALSRASGTALARASQPPARDHPGTVTLSEPRLRGTAAGRDVDGGVARVRISISERIACRHRGGRRSERLRTRYFPPPQIERIRSNPGARLPTSVMRSRRLALGGDRCGRGTPIAVQGELWGEAINGSGLEAVTPHLRFVWRR